MMFFVHDRKIYLCYTPKNTTHNTGCCMYETLKYYSDSFVLCYPTHKVISVIKKKVYDREGYLRPPCRPL